MAEIDWQKYVSLPFNLAPRRVKNSAKACASRMSVPDMTGKDYYENRAKGLLFCNDCQPHWQPADNFKKRQQYCKPHYLVFQRRRRAIIFAKKLNLSTQAVLKNFSSDWGTCLDPGCGESFKKKPQSNKHFCRECYSGNLGGRRSAAQLRNSAKKLGLDPDLYIENFKDGKKYCRECKTFWVPKTKKARCPRCHAGDWVTNNKVIITFAEKHKLDVKVHVEKAKAGQYCCRKCFHYNPKTAKTCGNCHKSPRCPPPSPERKARLKRYYQEVTKLCRKKRTP